MPASPLTETDRSTVHAGVRAGALLLAAAAIAVSACTNSRDSTPGESPDTVVTRLACQVPLTGEWHQTLAESRVDAGEWSEPMAVGPGGEVIARRADDVVLIEPDKSVSTVYTLPAPAEEYVKVVEVDERWIVLGLSDKQSRYDVSTELDRVAVVNRDDGSIRTIAEISDADYRAGRNMLDSVALFDDTVYWITHDSDGPDDGTLRSHALTTGTETDVESGSMRNLRATATGLAWTAGRPALRTVFRALVPLPAALSALTGINEDQTTLVRDGDVYAWITGIAAGGTGIARWSPDTGLTRVDTVQLVDGDRVTLPSVHIAGPYVLLGREDSTPTTLVDTRSGALALLEYRVIGAANANIGIRIGDWGQTSAPNTGAVRVGSLPPLSCSSSDTIRPSCEVSLPGKWWQALENNVVGTGASTQPLAVGPAGEIAARYDDGASRRLLLIDPVENVKIVYTIADPGIENVGFAALDERWIVVGVDRSARVPNDGRAYLDEDGELTAMNGPPPKLTRIDVIDRSDGSVRTIMERTAGDRAHRGDSLAVFDHTVYWSTDEDGANAVVQAYDLDTGKVAKIASADRIEDLRVTPVGIAWTEADRNPQLAEHRVTEPPAALAAAGVAPGDDSLVTDGTSYAWLTDEGIAHWSPDSGVNRVATVDTWRNGHHPIHVVGPYVIVEGSQHGAGEATVVDTRSGAVVSVDARIVATGGGTVAAQVPANGYQPAQTNLVRLTELPPLTC